MLSPARYPLGTASVLVLAMVSALLVVVGAACAPTASAPAYPTKPIDMVVPFAAGGTTDLVARVMGPYLQKKWGQPANVVNKAGGGGTPGTVSVLQAPADGYSVVVLASSNGVLNDALQKDLPYHWNTMTHLSRISLTALVFVVKGDSKFTSLKDFGEEMKKDPKKLKYGSSGVAGPSAFATAQFAQAIGVDPSKIEFVTFDGGAPTATAVAGGHVDIAAQNLPEVLELVKGGQLKALAVTTPDRVKELPNVPTTKELDLASVKQIGYFGVAGPEKLPAEITKKWDDTIGEAMKDPQVLADLEKAGTIPGYQNSADFRAFMEGEYMISLDLAEKLGLRK